MGVHTRNTERFVTKLMHHWHGPLRIVEKMLTSPLQIANLRDNHLVSITVHANRMKPYYDPDSRPQAPPSIEMLDKQPIPDNELPDDALTSNAKAHKSTSDQPIPIDTLADPNT